MGTNYSVTPDGILTISGATPRITTDAGKNLILSPDTTGIIIIGGSAPTIQSITAAPLILSTLDGDNHIQLNPHNAGCVHIGGSTPTLGTVENNLIISTEISGSLILNPVDCVGIGTSTFDALNPERLKVEAIEDSFNVIVAEGNVDDYVQSNIKNRNSGNSASSDIVATSDIGTEDNHYINLGINSSTYNDPDFSIVGPNDCYLIAASSHLAIGTDDDASSIKLFTGGSENTNERVRIDETGLVTIYNNNLDMSTNLINNLGDPVNPGDAMSLGWWEANGNSVISSNTASTGVLMGGVMSRNVGDPQKFDITDGSGYVINNYTDALAPVRTLVTWTGLTAITVTNLATADQTYVGINSSGTVIQQTSDFTNGQRCDIMYIGVIFHSSRTYVDLVIPAVMVAYDGERLLVNFARSIGPLNIEGNNFTASILPSFASTATTITTGSNECRAIVDDGTYIWMGLGTLPAQLVRVTKSTRAFTVYTLGVNEDICTSLADDGTYIWMGLGTIPAKLVRVTKATPAVYTTYTLDGFGEGVCLSVVVDANDVWMGLDTAPALLVKVPTIGWPLPPLSHTSYNIGPLSAYGSALVDDGTYIWVGTFTSPAELIQVTKATPAVYTSYTIEDNCTSLVDDGTYIWMGLATSPAKLVRVTKATPAVYTTYTLATGENDCYAISDDGTYIWMGLGTSPAKIIRVTKATPGTYTSINLSSGQNDCRGIVADGTNVWNGLNVSPAKLVDLFPGYQSIDKNAGVTFSVGAGYVADRKTPNTKIDSAAIQTYFIPSYRSATPGVWTRKSPTRIIDSNFYDDGSGTLHAVTAGYWTIQTIFFFCGGPLVCLQYGQEEYVDKATAEAAMQTAIQFDPTAQTATFRTWLVVQQGADDLTDSSQASFFQAGKFGMAGAIGGSGGSGGGEVNTASNAGNGAGNVGPFYQKLGVDLQFKGINAASGKIMVTDNVTDHDIDIDVDPSAILHSELGSLVAPADDHTQYLLCAGTRAMAGNLTLPLANSIYWLGVAPPATDTRLHRASSSLLSVDGSFAGEVKIGMTGANTPEVRLYNVAGDSSPMSALTKSQLQFGVGSVTPLDTFFGRNASSLIQITGALAGDVQVGMTGANTPNISLRNETGDANPSTQITKGQISFGAGVASVIDVNILRNASSLIQITGALAGDVRLGMIGGAGLPEVALRAAVADGTPAMRLTTAGLTSAGSITLTGASNGSINLTPQGTGGVIITSQSRNYLSLPSMTTANLPATPSNGMTVYDSTLNAFKVYQNNVWMWMINGVSFQFSRATIVAGSDVYLKVGEVIPTAARGMRMQRNGMILSASIQNTNSVTRTISIRINGVSVATISLAAATGGQTTGLSVNFNAGDLLTMVCNSTVSDAMADGMGSVEVVWR